jgi:hypothetical protein
MNIIETIKTKVLENGEADVAKMLQVKRPVIRGYLDGCTPHHDVCQRVVDLWFIESRPYRYEDPAIMWKERDMCLLMAVYKSIHPYTHYSIMAFWDKTTMRYQQRAGDGMIARSRNHLTRRFLRDTECQWSLWLDDDMAFPWGDGNEFNYRTGMKLPDAFASLVTPKRLVSWEKTIVAGCYWDRHGQNTLTIGSNRAIMVRPPHNSIVPITYSGTGCLLVHRQVYEDIAKMFPETYDQNAPGNECGFFTPRQTESGRMMGEDESFGWRALQAGHQTFLDMGLICGHYGEACYGVPE